MPQRIMKLVHGSWLVVTFGRDRRALGGVPPVHLPLCCTKCKQSIHSFTSSVLNHRIAYRGCGERMCLGLLKAKFHYSSWFEAGSKPNSITLSGSNQLRASCEPAPNQLWISSEPAPNQLRTSSEPASIMEFGFKGLRKFIFATKTQLDISSCCSIN